MDPRVLAGDVINIVTKNMVSTTFAFDGADWSAEDIRTLIRNSRSRPRRRSSRCAASGSAATSS